MAVVEDVDTMGRKRAICPDCGAKRYRGKVFPTGSERCVWCEELRVGEKTCSKCGETKPLEDFTKSYKFLAGRTSICKGCSNAYQAEWKRINPDKARAYQRKSQIGVTAEQYNAAVAASTGCPICKKVWTTTPHADHDHRTGRFRGVLCGSCNRGLGLFGDDVGALEAAIEYLEGSE
jgi:hypothetical protein